MSMTRIGARLAALIAAFCLTLLFGEQKSAFSGAQEFPVTMRQNVVAGKTPVGTKVEASLTIATLVAGKVIPVGAIFSGEVVESVAKSATNPSRLSVCMNSMRWKRGSASIRAYLIAWYYPIQISLGEDRSDERPGVVKQSKRGTIYLPNSTDSQIFPDRSGRVRPDPTGAQISNISDHPVVMKDVQSVRNNDAGVALSSSRLNIKLDKTTTYVLATGDLTNVK